MPELKNTLQLRAVQTLTLSLTPQLQQAIRMLQLTTTEVRLEIDRMLEQNPMLEEVEDLFQDNIRSLDAIIDDSQPEQTVYDPFDNDLSASPADISLDSAVYLSEDGSQAHDTLSSINQSGEATPPQDEQPGFDNFTDTADKVRHQGSDADSVYEGQTSTSLKDHLTWQLDCSPLTGADRAAAEAIIDAIADNGYLTESLEELHQSLLPDWPELTLEEVGAVLKLIQHYDPLGVGSRTVPEYLLIQLNELPPDTPHLQLARRILTDFLPELARRDFRVLCQRLGIKEEILKQALQLITSLSQRPMQSRGGDKADFIIPDVLAYKDQNGEYQVILNPANALPHLGINKHYAALLKKLTDEHDRAYLQSSRQEAAYFIKALENRNSTVLTVARCIMRRQSDFLREGESAMHPLILNDVAAEVGLHESTVSRATTGKYIQTPRGTYELKYFFSSHVDTADGQAASATAIRALIKDLISKENPRHPLSDAALCTKLQEQGYKVARRTVAKYRESLGLAASSQRKCLV